ncbi:hypothetical protein LUW77_17440 [Streptomyces radiopugnans]|nr:hypothetical protein LUW77_17440 [Streptomyces radiopugnans]
MHRDVLLTLLRQMAGSEYVDYHQALEQILREAGGHAAPGVGTAAEAPPAWSGRDRRAPTARRRAATARATCRPVSSRTRTISLTDLLANHVKTSGTAGDRNSRR